MRRLDIHHHILPPAYVAKARDHVAAVAGEFAEQVLGWTPQRSIEAMDQAGVHMAVTSISSPGIHFGDGADAAGLARECNDYAADMAARHAGRFGIFAVLPLPDVDASLKEIDRAEDVKGFGLYTNYGGAWLGDAKFAPLLEELNRRKAVVFVHPLVCPRCTGMLASVPDAIMEYPFDTTRTIASLLYSGSFARYRDIRFVFTHGGGALPMLGHRIARYAAINKSIAERARGNAAEELRRLYFDVVSVTQPGPFAALTALVPTTQLLFGSDYPYWPPDMTVKGLAGLGLSDIDKAAIEGGNACKLLKLETERAL
jgi:predicted TIM-barrel fold metal-dependent hydrolase